MPFLLPKQNMCKRMCCEMSICLSLMFAEMQQDSLKPKTELEQSYDERQSLSKPLKHPFLQSFRRPLQSTLDMTTLMIGMGVAPRTLSFKGAPGTPFFMASDSKIPSMEVATKDHSSSNLLIFTLVRQCRQDGFFGLF